MVKVKLTTNCASHKFNNDYPVLLFYFDGSETNVRPMGTIANWQPTDLEYRNSIELLADNSPTFEEWLKTFVLERMNRFAKPKLKRDVICDLHNLAEVLQY